MHVVAADSCCVLRLIRSVEEVVLVTNEKHQGSLRSQQGSQFEETVCVYIFFCFLCILLCFICLIYLLSVFSQQAMLMRQQERLEGRVHNIDEQLTKLESDKTLMKVQYDTH